ncbi:NAD-dependent dehydratase [Pseudomonas sp. G11-1]|uniref:NAD-dependent epimerase/dehydratase family protein n=1 Tax=Halopseudomonas bauzanensis TaxID=653930 RepID=A0A4U0YTD9_9GAMM|nr:GDP-mannose 4,6-dehydratase [Halopseudomonas bauzanensis]MCO5786552.1 NAD-dependent dehydratase [Pseudomonas sp. G11-1]MCO5789778.1 NAD-dependent dehydratase [Pseudomonas sp. G11-2]TKA92303.1 NAD-dependent epimerase/dehydratase family protein [Halopseudomonas bauzanensis]
MSKLLVTGQSGFVGRHLLAHLANHQSEWQPVAAPSHDLLDTNSLDAWVSATRPDAVIHLAGQTFVPEAFRNPARTLQINLLGTLNLLQALKRNDFQGTFLYVSSGDVYGQVTAEQLPIDETLLPKPRNPYAVSKLAAENLCLQWSFSEPDWRIVIARPFNHIGPGQAADFLVPDMARQLIRIRKGLQLPRLQVGDVDVSRDFLDVRDVVRAYFHLLEKGQSGEIYNVCSGVERDIRELIMQMASLAEVEITLEQHPDRLRRAEQRRVAGSGEKLRAQTNWQPIITTTTTLHDVLSDWDERIHNNNE